MPEELDAVLDWEGVSLETGTILILRTGWLAWYLGLSSAEKQGLIGSVGRADHPFGCPGLHAGPATAAWLWDHLVAAVATDNPAVEALPVARDVGFLHYRLIPLLGMALGELWDLEELSATCKQTGRYEFMLFSGVMNVPRAAGSPSNAYAVF